jgi:hypothetical protein
MSELLKNTAILVEDFNEKIKQDLDSKGIDNSRVASNSLRVVVNEKENSVQSRGVFYLEYLNRGRPPGKFPPPDVIKDWVITKPVDINPFLVGRKIAREGTEIFKNRSKGIEVDKKSQELLKELKEKAPKWAKQDLLIQLKQFKKI